MAKPLSPLILNGKVVQYDRKVKSPERIFPTGEELFPSPLSTPKTASLNPKPQRIITDLRTDKDSPNSGSPDIVDKDPTRRTRSPKTDSQGDYVLVFNWPEN